MRSPFDDVIEAQQTPPVTARTLEARGGERRRPPGGKPLVRLLQLLESAGYTGPTETALDAAVSHENRDEFRKRAIQFSAAPSEEGHPGGPRAPRGRARRGAAEDAESSGVAPPGRM